MRSHVACLAFLAVLAGTLAPLRAKLPVELSLPEELESGLQSKADAAAIRRHAYELYRPYRRSTERVLARATTYTALFEHELQRRSLPTWLKYVPFAESKLERGAFSPVGAAGLWQLMPATARHYGLRINATVDERLEPVRATAAAAALLDDMYKIFDDWLLALAAYNCGPGRVQYAIRESGSRQYAKLRNWLPKQTRHYVVVLLSYIFVAEHSTELNLQPERIKRAVTTLEPVLIHEEITLQELAERLHWSLGQIRALNPAYRQGWIPASEKGNWLLLPEEAADCLPAFWPESSPGSWLHYRVRPGDSLHELAQRLNCQPRDFYTWQRRLQHNAHIVPGQSLYWQLPTPDEHRIYAALPLWALAAI